MAITLENLKDMRFILSKRGDALVSFIFSKFAFLVFGIMIMTAFFYIITVQKNIQELDELARTADGIANVIGTVSSSPFNVTVDYETKINCSINLINNSFVLASGGRNLTHPIYFPINTTGPVNFGDCLRISNINNVTGVKACH
jgi:hypothetical protein